MGDLYISGMQPLIGVSHTLSEFMFPLKALSGVRWHGDSNMVPVASGEIIGTLDPAVKRCISQFLSGHPIPYMAPTLQKQFFYYGSQT